MPQTAPTRPTHSTSKRRAVSPCAAESAPPTFDLADLQDFWWHALETWYMRLGDTRAIAACLQHNHPLTDLDALILADIVTGKLRHFGPKGGPTIERKLDTALRDDLIRWDFKHKKTSVPDLTVIAELAEQYFCSEDAIKKIVGRKLPGVRPTDDESPQFLGLLSERNAAFVKLRDIYKKKLSKVK